MSEQVDVTAYWSGHNNGRATEVEGVIRVSDVLEKLGVPAGTSNYTYAVNSESAKINDILRDGDIVGVSKSQNKSGRK